MNANLTVSALVIVTCVLLNLVLVGRITRFRMRGKVALGNGGQQDLEVAVRAHGNLVENALWAIALLLVAELMGANQWLLGALGAIFVVGRMLHAWGFIHSSGGSHPGRFWGALLSWLTHVVLALVVLWQTLYN